MPTSNADLAHDIFCTAAHGADSVLAAAVALVAAAAAFELPLRNHLPAEAAHRYAALIDAAGGLLVEHGAPLDFATPRGHA